MKINSILLVCGGDINLNQLKLYVQKSDFIIALDKGIDYLVDINCYPDIFMGDGDSTALDLSSLANLVNIKKYPPEKDNTDTELGILEALKYSADFIYILGATGGRLDHFMGNIAALGHGLNMHSKIYMIDICNRISLITGEAKIYKEYTYVSFIPYTDKVIGVSISGAKYNLTNADFIRTETLGISNEVAKEFIEIKFKEGVMLVIESNDLPKRES